MPSLIFLIIFNESGNDSNEWLSFRCYGTYIMSVDSTFIFIVLIFWFAFKSADPTTTNYDSPVLSFALIVEKSY